MRFSSFTASCHSYTQPDPDQRLLLSQMKLALPKQPPPMITSNIALIA
jgi:hypothetical protein